MSELYITSTHISKLGHNLLEVRERALRNLISKLKIGLPFDNAFARSKEILVKCFEWFLFEDRSSEETVLELIKDILQNEIGTILINHFGHKTITSRLERVRLQVDAQYISTVDDIMAYLKNKDNIVPPLISEIPLSYRSDENITNIAVESTATPIDGYVCSAPYDNGQQSGLPQTTSDKSTSKSSNHSQGGWNGTEHSILPHYTFCWQPLVTTDRHVLESVETSLKNPERPSLLIHTCYFFMDVMLRDFPPEVFLQRPTILKELERHFLVNSTCGTRLAIARCFLKFTQSLLRRIHYYSDPAVHNVKQYKRVFLQRYECNNSYTTNVKRMDHNNIAAMRCLEVPTPVYCLQTLLWSLEQFLSINYLGEYHKMDLKQLHIYLILLRLIESLVCVSCYSLNTQIWINHRSNPSDPLSQLTYRVLNKFAEVICNLFSEIICHDFLSPLYVIYMSLIVSFFKMLKHLIPLGETYITSPIRSALSIITSDMTIMLFYSNLHAALQEYAKSVVFEEVSKCFELQSIHKSMMAAVTILRSVDGQPHILISTTTYLTDIKDSLKCLKYHKNLLIIDIFVNLCCSNNFTNQIQDVVTDMVLSLLSDRDVDIKSKTYCVCKEKIATVMGPGKYVLKPIDTCIDFMLNVKVLTEITLNGLSSEIFEVRQNAEDIILIMLKCATIVSESIWSKVVELILLIFPALSCFVNVTTPLGQTILHIIDPDRAHSMGITLPTVFKGNLSFLFSSHTAVRNEAISRLCWLLSQQPDHKKLLPRLNNISNRSFNNLCYPKYCVDVNRFRETQKFYQSCGIEKVLQLLEAHNVEPLIRRSALTQLSVMTEDHSVHNAFLESDGITKMIAILQNALTEEYFQDYPDSVIPVIATLKNLALHSSSVRQTLCTDSGLLYFILRAMLLYCTDDRLISDSSVLMFLLLFNDFLRGSAIQSNLSLPSTILKTMRPPFVCTEFKNNSEDYTDISLEGKQSLFFLKLIWNLLWYGGQEELISWKEPKHDHRFNEALRLTDGELLRIQQTVMGYSIKQCFDQIQKHDRDQDTGDAIINLIGHIHLYQMLSMDYSIEFDLLSMPWAATFERFLIMDPSNEHDAQVLLHVFECLQLVVPLYKMFGKQCWICDPISCGDNPLLSILKQNTNQCEDGKELKQELYSLIIICAHSEQHYLQFYEGTTSKTTSFLNIIEIIADCLKHEDAQGFYNLALLDSMLSCLVNLTGCLGWYRSDLPELHYNKHMLLQMACRLCELIGTFHCGKGQSASESVMGVSISRNAILALNHLLMEMHYWNFDNWNTCFTEEGSGIDNNLLNLFLLYTSRDVIVRASTFQLFTGLFRSIDCIVELLEGIKKRDGCDLQELLIDILLDEDEASLVKENVANALCNYLGTLHKSANVQVLNDMVNILDRTNFYSKIAAATGSFYLSDNFYGNNEQYFNHFFGVENTCERDEGTLSDAYRINVPRNENLMVISPGCMKSLASLLLHMLQIFSSNVITYIIEHHMAKRFLRLLSIPSMEISTTRDITLYCNVMEMNITICSFATQVLGEGYHLNSIMSYDDSVAPMVSLLNVNLYCIKLNQLLYLRNKLWAKIFYLLAAIFYYLYQGEQHNRTFEGLVTSKINQYYLQSLCESLSSIEFRDLQESALKNLTSMLTFHDESLSSQSSVRTLLDEMSTPRVEIVSHVLEDLENISPNCQTSTTSRILDKSSELPKAGAEICKCLFHLLQLATVSINKAESKRKGLLLSTLSGIVSVSLEAKQYALEYGGVLFAIKQLKELHFKLSLEPLESLRKVANKKRIAPLLTELGNLLRFLNNLAVSSEKVKVEFNKFGFSDVIHKHWNWICAVPNLLVDTLKTLCTFTSDCLIACDSLCMTNSIAGSGPKKTPGTTSLVNAVIEVILREMDLVSKIHDLETIKLCFHLLQNCCCSMECRVAIAKTNLLRSITKLHPYITKRQKVWEQVQQCWLEFSEIFTSYPEGQSIISKFPELLQIFIALTGSGPKETKVTAMTILRNISFSAANRPRLLGSGEYLQTLSEKLTSGSLEEQLLVVSAMWTLAANNQKAKLILKCSGLDIKLQSALQAIHLSNNYEQVDEDQLQKMHYVLELLRDRDK